MQIWDLLTKNQTPWKEQQGVKRQESALLNKANSLVLAPKASFLAGLCNTGVWKMECWRRILHTFDDSEPHCAVLLSARSADSRLHSVKTTQVKCKVQLACVKYDHAVIIAIAFVFTIAAALWIYVSISAHVVSLSISTRSLEVFILTLMNLLGLSAHIQLWWCSDSDESRQCLSNCSGVVFWQWWISSVS